ncbi:MAG: hypothetical protein Q4E01_06340 [Actinomycetaceae bacterium]|nr:hypothetical protein [Actinomycetaceae bacterium]
MANGEVPENVENEAAESAKSLQKVRDLAAVLKEQVGGLSQEAVVAKLSVPAKPAARGLVAWIREKHPNISQRDLIEMLENLYLAETVAGATLVGGVSAVPVVGTASGSALAVTDILTFNYLTAVHVYALLEAMGADIEDVVRVNSLILTIAGGNAGSSGIKKASERTGRHWGMKVLNRIPGSSLKPINRVLGRHFVTKTGTKQGIIVLGKVLPFGFGALIGAGLTFWFARGMVVATRKTLGVTFDGVDEFRDAVDYFKNAKAPEPPTDLESVEDVTFEDLSDLPGFEQISGVTELPDLSQLPDFTQILEGSEDLDLSEVIAALDDAVILEEESSTSADSPNLFLGFAVPEDEVADAEVDAEGSGGFERVSRWRVFRLPRRRSETEEE